MISLTRSLRNNLGRHAAVDMEAEQLARGGGSLPTDSGSKMLIGSGSKRVFKNRIFFSGKMASVRFCVLCVLYFVCVYVCICARFRA